MFGDGASNAGNFGETMNLAALWKLPALFLVENNLYGMGTSIERHSAQTDLSKKAKGYGIEGTRVDGMDVMAIRESVGEGIRLAREEARPTLLEAFTYRYRAIGRRSGCSTGTARRSRSGARKTRSRPLRSGVSRPMCWASARSGRFAITPSRR